MRRSVVIICLSPGTLQTLGRRAAPRPGQGGTSDPQRMGHVVVAVDLIVGDPGDQLAGWVGVEFQAVAARILVRFS